MSKLQWTTDLFPCFQFPVKYLSELFTDTLYKYISDNNLLSTNQSDFRTGDSWINQLLSITHDVYYSFKERFEIRAEFPDI